MEARELIGRLAGGDKPHAAALKASVPPKTLDTQIRSATGLKPDMVVRIARAYGSDPVVALVELGLITAKEAGARHELSEADHIAWLREAGDQVLLDEIGRRLNEREEVERPDGR